MEFKMSMRSHQTILRFFAEQKLKKENSVLEKEKEQKTENLVVNETVSVFDSDNSTNLLKTAVFEAVEEVKEVEMPVASLSVEEKPKKKPSGKKKTK